MPYRASRSAVPLPTVHSRGPFSARTSRVPSRNAVMNDSTALALVNTIQSKAARVGGRAQQRIGIVRRHDADHRRFDGFGAEHRQPIDHLGRLIARPRHEHARAEQRTRVEPAQVIAEADHAPDDENRRPAPRLLAYAARAAPRACRPRVSWLGSVPL